MSSMKKINCIYAKNKLDFKKYCKNSSAEDVVSYHDIISKLIKNDIDGIKPSDLVINSYIRKKLFKAVTDADYILYALKNLDVETIDSIRSLIFEVYESEIVFMLTIVNYKKNSLEIPEEVVSRFNEVVLVDYAQS